jgi:peptidoglycan LD-endopeptidase LytH
MKNKAIILHILIIGSLFAFSPAYAADAYDWYYFGQVSSSARADIQNLDDAPALEMRIPVLLDVSRSQLTDTWGNARSNGRTHEGVDIIAPKGAFIVSPTEAVVTRIGYGSTGGNYVYTANPGKETFYYAHLDSAKAGLKVGDVLKPGDLIGYVGNTGNASATSPHLHLTIYNSSGPLNPFPRLTKEFTLKERIESITKVLKDAGNGEAALAQGLAVSQKNLFLAAITANISIPQSIATVLRVQSPTPSTAPAPTATMTRNLAVGMSGDDVKRLQLFLITQKKGSAATALASTGYFGPLTKRALAEYQASVGIAPATGYFGPVTRTYVITKGL